MSKPFIFIILIFFETTTATEVHAEKEYTYAEKRNLVQKRREERQSKKIEKEIGEMITVEKQYLRKLTPNEFEALANQPNLERFEYLELFRELGRGDEMMTEVSVATREKVLHGIQYSRAEAHPDFIKKTYLDYLRKRSPKESEAIYRQFLKNDPESDIRNFKAFAKSFEDVPLNHQTYLEFLLKSSEANVDYYSSAYKKFARDTHANVSADFAKLVETVVVVGGNNNLRYRNYLLKKIAQKEDFPNPFEKADFMNTLFSNPNHPPNEDALAAFVRTERLHFESASKSSAAQKRLNYVATHRNPSKQMVVNFFENLLQNPEFADLPPALLSQYQTQIVKPGKNKTNCFFNHIADTTKMLFGKE